VIETKFLVADKNDLEKCLKESRNIGIENIGDGSLRVVSSDGQSFLVPKQEKEVVLFLKRLSRIF